MLNVIVAMLVLALTFGVPSMASESTASQLLRKRYFSEIKGEGTGVLRLSAKRLRRGPGASMAADSVLARRR